MSARSHRHATSVTTSHAVCRRITAHHARSFYYASPVLPAAKRRAAYAIYAFCRVADDAVDRSAEVGGPSAVQAALADLHHWLDAAYADDPSAETAPPWWPAFRETVQRYAIPQSVFADLLDGVTMDLSRSRYDTFDELLEYCHKVAGVVGLMMTHVFGFEHRRTLTHAAAMGVAMQLTNILRDVAEDASIDRCYLPAEMLAAGELTHDEIIAAATHSELARASVVQRLQPTVAELIARTRRYYAYAFAGVGGIVDPLGRACVMVMGNVYGDILRAIEEQHCDPFAGRAHRTGRQKTARVAGTLIRLDHWLPRKPLPGVEPPPMWWTEPDGG